VPNYETNENFLNERRGEVTEMRLSLRRAPLNNFK